MTIAVLGLGSVVALPLAARALRAGTPLASTPLVPLSRVATVGLTATFGTGIGLDVLAHGGYHGTWWFRLAGLSMLVAGAALAYVRRVLRGAGSGAVAPVDAARRVTVTSVAVCACIVWIVALMELKPFG